MSFDHLLISDLDDTLVDTSDIYWRARSVFVSEVGHLGFCDEEVIELFEKIDTDHLRTYGYSPNRYRKSMLGTYQTLLLRCGMPPSNETLRRIESCGDLILTGVPQLIDGARELLTWAGARYALALITRGEVQHQRRKLQLTGLSDFFRFVEVVLDKRADTFTNIIRAAGAAPDQTWVLGDSIRTDINPGIAAGATCILYAYRHRAYQWRQEHGHPAIGPFYHAAHLTQVINILESPASFQKITEFTA